MSIALIIQNNATITAATANRLAENTGPIPVGEALLWIACVTVPFVLIAVAYCWPDIKQFFKSLTAAQPKE